jgi:hypothetical protein
MMKFVTKELMTGAPTENRTEKTLNVPSHEVLRVVGDLETRKIR